MQVKFKLNATLRKYLPAGSSDGVLVVELPAGATVAEAIDHMGIPSDHAKIIVCGNDHLEPAAVLRDGQEVNLFPPLAGG